MARLSAVLITLDEEGNIREALDTVAFCDERVVVDAGSRDRTRELATAAGARVVLGTPWPGFVEQRNRAVAEARHDWVLCVDADERVTPELRSEIETRARDGFDADGYRIPRVTRYLGCWIRGTDWYPDLQLRLFDRRRGRWQGGSVHESVACSGTVKRMRGEFQHRPYRDVAHHLATIDRYTTLWAADAARSGRRASSTGLIASPCAAFLRNYILRRGIALGVPGLIVSVLNSYYTFVKLVKLREAHRTQPLA